MAVYKYPYFPDIHEFHNSLLKRTILERVDRPKAPVIFSYKKEQTFLIWCLLDSGADNIVLNDEIAEALNIDLSKAPEFKTGVVGGGNIIVKRHPIDVIFEGRKFALEADFSDSHRYPILGRKFFNVLDAITFKDKEKVTDLVLMTKSN
jgi:predicted aspartyl protease